MNTPAHAIVNMAVLGRNGISTTTAWIIAIGAILPDIPIVIFYLTEKFINKTSESVIWGELYETSAWYSVTTSLHSFVIVGIMILFFFLCLKW